MVQQSSHPDQDVIFPANTNNSFTACCHIWKIVIGVVGVGGGILIRQHHDVAVQEQRWRWHVYNGEETVEKIIHGAPIYITDGGR